MKNQTQRFTQAGLLLAAAALPLSSLVAQVTQAPPTTDVPPPVFEQPAAPVPLAAPPPAAPAPVMEPVVNTQPSGNEVPAPAPRATTPRPTTTATRTTPARARPAPVRARTTAPAPAAAPEPAAVEAAAPPTTLEAALTPAITDADMTTAEVPATIPVQVLPNEEPQRSPLARLLPWLLGAAVVFGAIALLLFRRQRRAAAFRSDEAREPTFREALARAEDRGLLETAPAPIADTPAFEPTRKPKRAIPVAAVAAAATAPSFFTRDDKEPLVETGVESVPVAAAVQPEMQMEMRPVRAGVKGEDAVVEFQLTLDNRGGARATDVRVSTWMLPAGATYANDMERMLIPPRAEESTVPEVKAGQAKRIERTVALPTSRVHEDSVLPVVAAEARYRLDDGSEHRLFKQFAVGVPLEGQLAHFDVANPSGMHDNVEARLIEDLEPA